MTSLTAISVTSIFVLDQDRALDFYVGTLGLEVVADQSFGALRWLTVAPAGHPDRQILLELPAPPSMDEATAATVRGHVAKGAGGGWVGFATDDVKGMHERLVAAGVEITDGPNEQPYGTDIGLRDPFGNALRISQPRT